MRDKDFSVSLSVIKKRWHCRLWTAVFSSAIDNTGFASFSTSLSDLLFSFGLLLSSLFFCGIVLFTVKLSVVDDSVSNSHEHTHECVTMNTVVQIKQCNRSCWLFPWLHIAGMQIGRWQLSWTAWVGGIWPALAAIRSDQHPFLYIGWHADSISVVPTASTLLTEVSCKDGQMYVLSGSVVGFGPKNQFVITEGTLYPSMY